MIAIVTETETVVNSVTMIAMIAGLSAGLIATTGTAIAMIAGSMNNGERIGTGIAGFTNR